MIDKPLQINDRTVHLGEMLMQIRPRKRKTDTFLQLYGLWRFYQSREELKKYGAENPPAFWFALLNSLDPRRFSKGYRRSLAGLYHWYRYVWLPKRYKSLLEQIQRVNRQIRKVNKDN